MRSMHLITCAFLLLAFFGLPPNAAAQFPAKIKIPKVSEPKPQPTASPATQPTTNAAAQPGANNSAKPVIASGAAGENTEPTIIKSSVQLDAKKVGSYRGSFDTWSWVPSIRYIVNGPIARGSQLYAEFSLPTGGAWLKFDCPTEAIDAQHTWTASCGGFDIRDDDSKGTTYTGPVSFAIKVRNELAGTDAVLFAGKFKVGKVHSNEVGPKAANRFVYYVDKDWNLPIGYVYLAPGEGKGWDAPFLNVLFWMRGETNDLEPHLFYQGKEVGTTTSTLDGKTSGGVCGRDTRLREVTLTDVDRDVAYKYNWARVRCEFGHVLGWDKTGEKPNPIFGPPYQLASNPGEYELKILWKTHVARSIKFTVGPDGRIVDNGIASSNKLGTRDTVIVPVQVIGDQDGQWDRNAWRTDAFYGNPLNGFTPPQ